VILLFEVDEKNAEKQKKQHWHTHKKAWQNELGKRTTNYSYLSGLNL
jgi:hypothetical protein